MIADWFDVMTKLWGTISDGRGGTVLAYSAFDRSNWPKKIEKFPSALSYVNDLEPTYSASGPFQLIWSGATEFHIIPDLAPEGIPVVESYFKRILEIAAGNIKLKNKCSEWSIQGPNGGIKHVQLEYGDQPLHRGLLVNWTVHENVSGLITVSA